jgi:hypothetical protein
MKKLVPAAILVAALVPAAAAAQPAPPPIDPAQIFGDPTRDQVKAMASGLFDRLDVNHDGIATREEAEQIRAQLPPAPVGSPQQQIGQVFALVPSISREQFVAVIVGAFDQADLNHDGKLTKDERDKAKAALAGAMAPQGSGK